ncbi:unnamed protein product, partial [Adineta steineri]
MENGRYVNSFNSQYTSSGWMSVLKWKITTRSNV